MKNKRILMLFTTFIIIFATIIPTTVYATTETKDQIYVYDNADILTSDEENALQRIAKKYEEYDTSVIFLTADSTNDMSTSSYIRKFYNSKSFSPDGVVFFINTDPNNYVAYIDTIGKCIDTFPISEMDTILQTHSYLATAENEFEFFSAIERDSSDFIIESSNTTSLLIPTKGSIATTVIVVIFWVIFLITKHNAANKRPKAQIYLNQTFEVISKREVFKGDRREVLKDYYKTDVRKTGTGVGFPGKRGRRF